MPDILQLKVYVNHPLGGVSENYFLGTSDKTTAIKDAQDYMEYRKRILPTFGYIAGASITTYGKPPNSLCLPLDFPIYNSELGFQAIGQLPGAPQDDLGPYGKTEPAAINTVQAGVHVRFTSATGVNANRTYRIIPDAFVVGGKMSFPIVGLEFANGNAPYPVADDPELMMKNIIIWTLNRTMHGHTAFNPRAIEFISNAVGATVVTTTPHGITGTPKVIISGVIPETWNGIYNVVSTPTAKQFTIDNLVAAGPYVTGGRVRADRSSLTLSGWSHACVIRPSVKRVGRPFGPFRGRRSIRKVS